MKVKFQNPILIVLLVFVFTSCRSIINVEKFNEPAIYTSSSGLIESLPAIKLSKIITGYSESPEAFVYRGGSIFKKVKIAHAAVVIDHPKGRVLFDTGLGSNIKKEFADNFSAIQRAASKFVYLGSADSILSSCDSVPVQHIIVSHMHWDHIGGLNDFPDATVHIHPEEKRYACSEEATKPFYIKAQYNNPKVRWESILFDSIPYEVFDRSFDVFTDRSLVVVPLPGHTSGSIGLFVNLSSRKRYFFIGDLSWSAKGGSRPSEKHCIPRKKVDQNRKTVQENLVLVNYLNRIKEEIIIVPSHDYEVLQSISSFPLYEE